MGKGIIKANVGGGQYIVEVVYDRTKIDAELTALATKKTNLEGKKAGASEEELKSINLQILSIDKRTAFLTENCPQNVQLSMYCADFTSDLAIDAVVGLIEISRQYRYALLVGGEVRYRQLFVIQPGYGGNAAYSSERDGILGYAFSMSPSGLFYNMAMSPGAMRWKPRYRVGTIQSVNGDYADVNLEDYVYLADADSPRVDIDDTTKLELESVPISYMDCNGLAFEDGDEVVIEFQNNDWNQPRVIGFVGPPQECSETRYYSVMFFKPSWGSSDLPDTVFQVSGEKYFFKIISTGDIVWVTEGEAASQCNSDDCWNSTSIRSYGTLFRWFHDAGEGWKVQGQAGQFICEGSLHEKDYLSEPNPPDNLGVFDLQYPDHSKAYPWMGDGVHSGAPDFYYRYEIDGEVFLIWSSLLAVGLCTRYHTKSFIKNNVRKVQTEVYTDKRVGSYSVTYRSQEPLAIPRRVGGFVNNFAQVYVPYLLWPYSHSYGPDGEFGGTSGPYNLIHYHTSPPYDAYENPDIAYYIDFFNLDKEEHDTWWPDHVVYFAEIQVGFYPDGNPMFEQVGATETVLVNNSSWDWDEGPCGLTAGTETNSYEKACSIDTEGNSVGAIIGPSPYLVYQTPAGYYDSEGLLHDDSQDGWAPESIGFSSPRGYFGESVQTVVNPPTCFVRWENERAVSQGEEYTKQSSDFPVEVDNYDSDNEIFIELETYNPEFVGDYGERITRVAWELYIDPENPDAEPTMLILWVDFIQTSMDGNTFPYPLTTYDNKYLIAVIDRSTGEILDSNVYTGQSSGGMDITDQGKYIFNEEYFDAAAYAAAMEAKRTEVGATYYRVFNLVKK